MSPPRGREAVMQALFLLLTDGGPWQTAGRRLKMWTEVQKQPALYLRHMNDEAPARPTGMPAKTTLECEVWIYDSSGKRDGAVPDEALNRLLDFVGQRLKPPPGQRAQTLGGLVAHAWIEGRTEIHPGDLDGQAIAVVPIKLLAPALP